MTTPIVSPANGGKRLGPQDHDEASQDDPRVLTARLQTIRRQRIADEREADQLPQLLRAITLVRRDRDAGTNRQMLRHRAQLERLWADVEDLVITIARVAVRTQLRDAEPGDPVVHDAKQALQRAQQAIQILGDAIEDQP